MFSPAVLAAYREGVSAIEHYSAKIETVGAWTALACGRWTAVDLAGHLLIIAEWYQEWLERAVRGTRGISAGWSGRLTIRRILKCW